MRNFIAATSIVVTSLLFPMIAKAQGGGSFEMDNPVWQEVPGTFTPGEGFDDSAYVDVNGFFRSGDIVTYDVLGPDVGYGRAEANCRTNQFRWVRQGNFDVNGRVSYSSVVDSWSTPAGPYQRALQRFVCSL